MHETRARAGRCPTFKHPRGDARAGAAWRARTGRSGLRERGAARYRGRLRTRAHANPRAPHALHGARFRRRREPHLAIRRAMAGVGQLQNRARRHARGQRERCADKRRPAQGAGCGGRRAKALDEHKRANRRRGRSSGPGRTRSAQIRAPGRDGGPTSDHEERNDESVLRTTHAEQPNGHILPRRTGPAPGPSCSGCCARERTPRPCAPARRRTA